IGKVGGAQISGFDIRRNHAPGRVILIMKRHLAGNVNPPRRHESEPRGGQGPAERLPRRWIQVDHPSIGKVAFPGIFFLDARDIVNRHGASLAMLPVLVSSVASRFSWLPARRSGLKTGGRPTHQNARAVSAQAWPAY